VGCVKEVMDVYQVLLQEMKISKIKPYIYNAKKHTKKQIEQVAASIREFGFNQPIVLDKKNFIIVGHGRYEAAKLLELKDVPTIVVDLTEEQANAYRLADNKLNESEWDMKLVIDELKTLSLPMLELTGFDKDLLISPDAKDDIIPENVPARSKLGDLYELGSHRVLAGDSTQQEAVSRLMDGKKADMVFTDPPYGMNLDTDYISQYKGESKKALTDNLVARKYEKIVGDDKPFDAKLFIDLFSYCKEQFWFGADYYMRTIEDNGSWIVWDKTGGHESLDNVGFASNFELCWSRKKHKRDIARITRKGIAGHNDGKRVHPTMKPIALCCWFVQKFSKENELIVDLFLGSGSTLIACEKTGRICYGMELDPKYCDVIVQRYVDFVEGAKVIRNGMIDTSWKQSLKTTK